MKQITFDIGAIKSQTPDSSDVNLANCLHRSSAEFYPEFTELLVTMHHSVMSQNYEVAGVILKQSEALYNHMKLETWPDFKTVIDTFNSSIIPLLDTSISVEVKADGEPVASAQEPSTLIRFIGGTGIGLLIEMVQNINSDRSKPFPAPTIPESSSCPTAINLLLCAALARNYSEYSQALTNYIKSQLAVCTKDF